MKTLSNIFSYTIAITGLLVFSFAGFALALQILDYTATCIFKRLRAWCILVEYFVQRKKFKQWLKKKGLCENCGDAIRADDGPPDGWQLEDGRTVCHSCCITDTRRVLEQNAQV